MRENKICAISYPGDDTQPQGLACETASMHCSATLVARYLRRSLQRVLQERLQPFGCRSFVQQANVSSSCFQKGLPWMSWQASTSPWDIGCYELLAHIALVLLLAASMPGGRARICVRSMCDNSAAEATINKLMTSSPMLFRPTVSSSGFQHG